MFEGQLKSRLATCLFLLRLGIAAVMLMWTIDKFVNPEHAAKVFEKFYKMPGVGATIMYAIGGVQMAVILAFLAGVWKRFSYAIIGILHAISTVSSIPNYLDPWTYPNLLFFAALPMLAACWTVWSLRDYDTILSWDASRRSKFSKLTT